MSELLVISPHLDDAIFSIGGWLAGSSGTITLLTVLAGAPSAAKLATAYDVGCGFGTAEEAIEARRTEDANAALVIGATPLHLNFCDSQYGEPVARDTVAEKLVRIIEAGYESAALVAPLGIHHGDHLVVSDACLRAAARARVPIMLYEELPYRVLLPEFTAQRRDLLTRKLGLELLPMPAPPPGRKMAAVGCYRSQAPDPTDPCLHVPERIWARP